MMIEFCTYHDQQSNLAVAPTAGTTPLFMYVYPHKLFKSLFSDCKTVPA